MSQQNPLRCPDCGSWLNPDRVYQGIANGRQAKEVRVGVSCQACGYHATLLTTIRYAPFHSAVPTGPETIIRVPLVCRCSQAGLTLCANPGCQAIVLGTPRVYTLQGRRGSLYHIELCPQCYVALGDYLEYGRMQPGHWLSEESRPAQGLEAEDTSF